ncbi:hypothetical protein AA12717_0408 [Gluconacetobacter sacchari DSM 12717]|uniref:Uncharacterized protein n=2 Tax=Gluconacetobacter sacchari TaxID=92759 RepID=A0A7W4NLP2_9PROT|nr:hypothetical protein [Gluconacetobacter sacchari]MBB2160076.1 hypothetical protein [Gluconacetobacter sacchari]GBQ19947.1 hypothetical protein AA12717_0408 [Gluconacetobacter sacchari DSM 12717]
MTNQTGDLVINFTAGATLRAAQLNQIQQAKADVVSGQLWSTTLWDALFATEDATSAAVTLENLSGLSNRNAISFGQGGWQFGRDQSANGGDDLYLWHSATGNTPLRYTADDQLYLWSAIDKQLTSNAYGSVGVGVLLNQDLGKTTPVIGSTGALWINQNIYDVGKLDDGTYSEFSAVYTMTGPMDWAKILGPHHVIAYDNHCYSQCTTDPTKRSGMMFGMSLLGRAMGANDCVIDGIGSGSFGYAAATTPPSADEIAYYKGPAGTRSYPQTAGLSVAGISGTSDIYDGNQAGADYGFIYGFRVGGGGGTPYMHTDARSKLMYGGYIGDWDTYGLWIDHPLVSANGEYPASLVLAAQTGGASKYCALGLGIGADGTGGYLLVQDTAHNGAEDLGVYNRTTGQIALHISPTGGVSFNGATGYAPATLPAALTASSTLADVIATVQAIQAGGVACGLFNQAA